MPTYYHIDKTLARRAKEMSSYHDYKPGSATASYRQEVDKAAANMAEWKRIQGLLDKIRSAGMGGISSDDSGALQKLREKLAQRELMKAVNAFYRKYGTLDSCSLLSSEDIEELKAGIGRNWRANPKPYESYRLSNSNQTIRSIKDRIAELEAKQTSPAPEDWEFEGSRVAMNQEENRVQILFDGKSDADIRSTLKHAGFRWAPSQAAWQRMLNQNGIYAAKQLTEAWMTPSEEAEYAAEQTLEEEPCSEEPAPFSYLQQPM